MDTMLLELLVYLPAIDLVFEPANKSDTSIIGYQDFRPLEYAPKTRNVIVHHQDHVIVLKEPGLVGAGRRGYPRPHRNGREAVADHREGIEFAFTEDKFVRLKLVDRIQP